jgi:Flp pilus assembly protein TadD
VLRKAIEISPQDAGLHHALGLTLVRLKRQDEALAELRRATELEPDRANYAYVYAVGLNSTGRGPEAMAILRASLERHPGDRETLSALIGFARDAGDYAAALGYAERLAKIEPDNPDVARMVEELKHGEKPPGAQ